MKTAATLRLCAIILIGAFLIYLAFGAHLAKAATPDPYRCSGGVSWRDVGKYVGKDVKVFGHVMSGKYFKSAKGGYTFLDVGYAWPDKRGLSVVVWGANATKWVGSTICMYGNVKKYKGKVEVDVEAHIGTARRLSASTRNPECYVANPPKQVQRSGNLLIGTMQARCASALKVATQGVMSCLEREDRVIACVANQNHFKVAVNAVSNHICQYTTYGYRWRVSGYAWVRYIDGSTYTSLNYSSPPIIYKCH